MPVTKKKTSTKKSSKRVVFSADMARSHIKARYDVAQSTTENATLWTGVDSLSAAEANNPTVRKTIRERARYEIANNPYGAGIVRTITQDTVGSRVQLQLGDSKRAQEIEQDFMAWADAVKLWKKLRVMRSAKCVDGEVFGMLITNRRVPNEIKLDLQTIECDMIESYYTTTKTNEIDGIRFDEFGNPIEYRLLDEHPGDYRFATVSGKGRWVKAEYIIHYFTPERPGQVRGIPEISSSLTLFGQLRKYTAAVVEAASRAAEISAIMQTTQVPDGVAADLADPITIIEAQRNAIVSLPEGWTLAQLKAEQPTTTYEMFKNQIINEMARCINMPANVARGDSSGYNYASGRLDHQSYDKSLEVERAEIQSEILDRVYYAWLVEYAMRKSLSEKDKRLALVHEWHFSGRGHVDPNKEATADDVRFKNGSLTKSAYYAKQGKDWKREEQQWIRERIIAEQEWNEARKQAGLEPAPYPLSDMKMINTPEETNEE
jgi:lambda family phage portal protein